MTSFEEERSPPSDGRSAVEELIRGQEIGEQLVALLKQSSAWAGGLDPMIGYLMEGVLGSFSRALIALDSGVKPEEVSQVLNSGETGSGCSEENSSKKRKVSPAKDRRGGNRRRGNPSSIRKVQSKTMDDGNTWRKYGQKDIYSAKFPRSYFRCTHKHDRGCQATRQVQKSEEDPSVYCITYLGEHTCMHTTSTAKPLRDSYDGSSCLINFGLNTISVGPETPFSSSMPSSLRQECDEETLSSLSNPQTSSLEFGKPMNPVTSEEVVVSAVEVTGAVSDLGDATSSFLSCDSSLDHGFNMGDSFDIDDVLRFVQDDAFLVDF